MDFMLSKIIEIEKEAQRITDEAETAKQNLANEVEKAVKEIEINLQNEAQNKLNQFKNSEEEHEKEYVALLEEKYQQQIVFFSDLFSQKSKEWENEIYSAIIGK